MGLDTEKMIDEALAMKLAVAGECYGEYFHAFNWSDKPHRVVYDAARIIKDAAAELATLRAENERLRTLIERAGHKFGKCANLIDEASSRTATQNMSRVEYANLCAAECKEALK